ncbi:TIGR04219 family outer membrane beta-barrel protein [Shewanella sp.]|uniref:TIGR04219 family outer membrane beta-barrel protein n=1 Tax=Shewanella sp. TaxID=50422 RepID=UPI0035645EF5
MQKSFLTVALLTAMSVSSANAATVLGFKAGADYWHADAAGNLPADGGSLQSFEYDSSAHTSLWFAVEHPVPLLPNLLIRENRMQEHGAKSDADFSFGGIGFTGDVNSIMDLSNTDFVLYYELLDNDIVSLDVGGAYKKMHGSFRVGNGNGLSHQKDFDGAVIMGYASAVVGMPGLGLYGFADLMAGVNESQVYDYSVGLGWEFDGMALDTRVRAGYREFNFDVRSFDGITTDSHFKGYFAGVELLF